MLLNQDMRCVLKQMTLAVISVGMSYRGTIAEQESVLALRASPWIFIHFNSFLQSGLRRASRKNHAVVLGLAF